MADTASSTTTEGSSSLPQDATPIADSSVAASAPAASPIGEANSSETNSGTLQPSAPSSAGEKKAPLSSAAKQKYLMATRTNQSPKRSTPAASVLEKVNAAAAASADAEGATTGSTGSLTPLSATASSGSSGNVGGNAPATVASMKELVSSIKRDSGNTLLPASVSTPAAAQPGVTSSASLPAPLGSLPAASSQEKVSLQSSASDDNRSVIKDKSPRRSDDKKTKKEERPKQRIEKVCFLLFFQSS